MSKESHTPGGLRQTVKIEIVCKQLAINESSSNY